MSRPQTQHLSGKWIIRIRTLPLHLGHVVRLEDGVLYRGPALVRWWWRPTWAKALSKGYYEVFIEQTERANRRAGEERR